MQRSIEEAKAATTVKTSSVTEGVKEGMVEVTIGGLGKVQIPLDVLIKQLDTLKTSSATEEMAASITPPPPPTAHPSPAKPTAQQPAAATTPKSLPEAPRATSTALQTVAPEPARRPRPRRPRDHPHPHAGTFNPQQHARYQQYAEQDFIPRRLLDKALRQYIGGFKSSRRGGGEPPSVRRRNVVKGLMREDEEGLKHAGLREQEVGKEKGSEAAVKVANAAADENGMPNLDGLLSKIESGGDGHVQAKEVKVVRVEKEESEENITGLLIELARS